MSLSAGKYFSSISIFRCSQDLKHLKIMKFAYQFHGTISLSKVD